MILPRFELATPRSISEACRIAVEEGGNACMIAGGTDLLPALKYRLKKPGMLIDVGSLPELKRIEYSDEEGLTVGAAATLRRLASDPAIRELYPLLVQAALSVGSVQLQSMGTIGGNLCQDACCTYYNLPPMSRLGLPACFKLDGNLCHVVKGSEVCRAVYAGDMAPALLALQARVTIADAEGEKNIPLAAFFSGRGENPNVLGRGQILKEINIPPPSNNVGVYLKMRLRKSIDYPLLGVAVNLLSKDGRGNIEDILLSLTAVERSPLSIKAPENPAGAGKLERQIDIMAEAAYKQAHPLANTSGYSPRYRREMVKVYVRQAITEAASLLPGGGRSIE